MLPFFVATAKQSLLPQQLCHLSQYSSIPKNYIQLVYGIFFASYLNRVLTNTTYRPVIATSLIRYRYEQTRHTKKHG
jgi:hypothetical protein